MSTKTFSYTPQGVCSRQMEIETRDGIITDVTITGGCHGNSQGVCALVRGMEVKEVIGKLRGINCKGKGTSCPDQLAQALEQSLQE